MFTAVVAWAIAQLTKTIIFAIKERRLDFRRLVGTGGMPSSHTTFVTALTTGVGLVEGFDTPIFALAAAFALVVMYDAAGVRRAAGKQAKVLNRIIDDIYKKDFHPERLRELLGHTPIEVLAGAVFGITYTYLCLG
ncbi:MAG TPA: divergent PAP2 family protein [Limnochordia bacterium]|nr:divergent PAP2 family protein [Limnochordia bacterium]HPT93227.1 divergent PAP2 family protein [Limnochordia bacterium]HQD70321.1 divergent PAP2 family protein [Limnochordia bacterium]HXK96247.1 divergent PAP2 family protein [Limnochordia bacterium]